MFFRSRGLRRQMKSSRRKLIEETCLITRDLKRLSRQRSGNMIKATHKHRLMLAEINGLITNYLELLHQNDNTLRFLVSSLFLKESFRLLNQREVESLHFVTGPEFEGTKVLDRIVDLSLEQQSAVYAKADSDSIREALIYLTEHGFKLWGCFHIHPGCGPSSILPSTTDMTLDRLLIRGGYDCVGAIFSRDGFVRFFSSKKFAINIYGNGVEKVNEKTYRLVEID